MAKVQILKRDGTPTPYFWSDKDKGDQSQRTVYKQADGRVLRMKGVHFDATTLKIVKH